MDSVHIKNFRCFHENQSARLAPLTLLVGDNSTGKSSFLAMIRSLSDIASGLRNPDFSEEPYDLGSFDDIAYRSSRVEQAHTFAAGFETTFLTEQGTESSYRLDVTFGRVGNAAAQIQRRISLGEAWIEEIASQGRQNDVSFGTSRGSWRLKGSEDTGRKHDYSDGRLGPSLHVITDLMGLMTKRIKDEGDDLESLYGSPDVELNDFQIVTDLINPEPLNFAHNRPYAGAPVRSKPRRTYDPSPFRSGPEGDHVPLFLASVFSERRSSWLSLKQELDKFGRKSGLFDEINIRQFGSEGSDPFQIQILESGRQHDGPLRNLIDVGYGVSQVLPVVTDLLRSDSPSLFLLQQPEVHLHPSAQAAVGSLFCELASRGRQLIVETHSDHLLDRIRIDVRDGGSELNPEDVSVLFFERQERGVSIHSLGIDSGGNMTGGPPGYRRFFMEETRRSLGI